MTEWQIVVQATYFIRSRPFPQSHCRQSLLKILQLTDSTLSSDHSYLYVVAYKVNNEKRTGFPI